MNSTNLNFLQSRFLSDIDKLYEKIVEHDGNNNEKAIMGLLSHIKEKGLFEKDFFEYWLIKFLNSPRKIGFFYLDEPNYHILGFDAKTISPILCSHIKYLETNFHNEEVIELIEHALNNSCIFESVFFDCFSSDLISVDLSKKFKEKNSKNIEKYLKQCLTLKNQVKMVKI